MVEGHDTERLVRHIVGRVTCGEASYSNQVPPDAASMASSNNDSFMEQAALVDQ